MSRPNVEVVQAAFEAWKAGRMDALREMQDPDIVVRPPPGWPEPGPYVGRDDAMRHLVQNREAFDSNTLESVSDFTDTADQVVVRFVWHGAGQGPEADLEMTGLHTVRNGKVAGIEYFWDHAEALAAAEVHDAMRRSVEGINHRDMALIEGACDPDLELTSTFAAVEGRTYFGYAGARDYLADMEAALEGLNLTIEESVPVGDKLVVTLRLKGTGKSSGASFDQCVYGVYEFRKGKVLRARYSPNRAETFAAAGLSQ